MSKSGYFRTLTKRRGYGTEAIYDGADHFPASGG
jgi:hypothetical protein